ncbi:MAG: hypothetical protein IJL23_01900, partial [Alphaproteobacteria bacterium]|nr:hypothetical protein [Alphaproteobacteria bacterium]
GVQTSCVYDGTLTPPTTIPTKTGYTFKGWRVRQTSNSSSGGSSSCFAGVDASIASTYGGFKNDSTGRYGEWALEAETYGLTLDNTWAEEFTHGIVKGSAKCSANGGTYAMPGVPNDTKGRYCWCRVDSYEPANGNTCIVSNSSWLFSTVHTYAEDCDYDCVNNCGLELELYDSTFRRAVFGISQ